MRPKMMMIVALVLGLITTVLFFNYMRQADSQKASTEEMVEVVIAKERILENQKISAEMLEMATVPVKGLHPSAVKNISSVEGKRATAVIEKGEVLLSHRFKDLQEETKILSQKVQEGYRAVSVDVNFFQSVSNLIEPEDSVDVLLTEGEQASVRTRQILSNVRVLAVGQKLNGSEDLENTADSSAPANPETGSGQSAEWNSITLELKPEDVIVLVQASERGNIHLSLHSKILPAEETKK
ncbi:MAG TPA: Flp pilus assembly protein CpaB [Chondromyces sp.]|nr:Flp pilus assembly protein CpaB [Chondromyces sp.]